MTEVVLISEGVPSSWRKKLDDACRDLDVAARDWRPGERPASPTPRLIVGALRAGARRIPEDLLEAAERFGVRATLVLLASEPLVRPAVTLEDGRVVVVSPTSTTRVRGLLRMLTTETAGSRGDSAERGGAWSAQLGARAWTAHDESVRCVHEDTGFAAVVPFDGACVADVDEVLAEASTIDDLDSLVDLGRALGSSAGLVRLADGAASWLLYWPRADRTAWLHSPVRLPNGVDLAEIGGRAARHGVALPAHAGDCTLAFGGAAATGAAAEAEGMLEEGAAAVVAHLEARGGEARRAGFVAEVR